MLTGNPVLDISAFLAALGAGSYGLYWLVVKPFRWVRRQWRKVNHFFSDWFGEPGRPGVSARPGAMERFQQIEGRLNGLEGIVTNGLQETVVRIELNLGDLSRRFDEHGEESRRRNT